MLINSQFCPTLYVNNDFQIQKTTSSNLCNKHCFSPLFANTMMLSRNMFVIMFSLNEYCERKILFFALIQLIN